MSIRGTGKKHNIVRHNRLIKNYIPAEKAIVVNGLIKSFKRLKMLDGIDFVAKVGIVLALLGPKDAGKQPLFI